MTTSSHVNPLDATQKIAVYNPGGHARTPVTGGRCDDPKRPVVVVVHGLLAGIDSQMLGSSLLYADIIRHFASTGNVVVFASWPTNPYDFQSSFAREDQSLAVAKRYAPRGDFTRLGIVGHSMGGGATPYLAQQAVKRGWGSRALWLFQLAPAPASGVGTGPISVPPHTRIVVENYDGDNILDARIGIEQYRAYDVPRSQKQHVFVRSDTRGGPLASLRATHLSPNSLLAPDDAIRTYGIYRVGDALQGCSLTGQYCSTDLGYMGRWSDGVPVRRSVSSDDPVDAGPPATAFAPFGLRGECESPHNPRRARC
ncbi:hypothetical protein AAFP35_12320 [Gordonia sp. CPCC 206044]|uniref:alpha/beta hydrolase family protein n=1 Tax=Gordonia sp. CPCC 206044 TaxID=3140793 RepID=UPI003AF33A1E